MQGEVWNTYETGNSVGEVWDDFLLIVSKQIAKVYYDEICYVFSMEYAIP